MIHNPTPEKIKLRLETHPSGNANVKGIPITSAKDNEMNAKTVS